MPPRREKENRSDQTMLKDPDIAHIAPEHLSDQSKDWWEGVLREFHLAPHQIKLLQAACESWDRAQEARRAIEEHGVVTKGRYGQVVANPAAVIEKESRALFARLIAQLEFPVSKPEEELK
jgi:P27 family predicted phage terminase small subunit